MRILQVVHGFPPAASGGTEVYVHDLAVALAHGGANEVAILTRHDDPASRELQVRSTVREGLQIFSVNNTFQTSESFEASYANPAIEAIAGTILDDWRPDVLHLQHLTCLSTGIPRQARARHISVMMTLNDYWLICHRGQLVDLDGRRCDGPAENGCSRCIPSAFLASVPAFRAGRLLRSMPVPGAAAAVNAATRAWAALTPDDRTRDATRVRLRHMQAAVADIQLFLAPSNTLADRFSAFGIPADRLIRCRQGIALAPFERIERRPSERLRIGFAGGLLPTKGPNVLLDALDRLPSGSVVVDVLGRTGAYHGSDEFARALAPRLGHPAIRRLGPVSHERMPAVFQDLDLLIVPSIWIENAPFIIHEAFAAGMPVIASNLGGMAEMVRHGIDGLLFEPGDSQSLAQALQKFIAEPDLLPRLRAGIARPLSIEEDAAWLCERYQRLLHRESRVSAGQTRREDNPAAGLVQNALCSIVLNYRTPEQTSLTVRSLQRSEIPPDEILVVDNDSRDGSTELFRRTLRATRVIESAGNLGFAGGCNQGIRLALERGAERILLVNSDAVLPPDAVGHLLRAMHADPALGIVAPILLSREEPDHVSSAGIRFSERTARMRHRFAGRRLAALGIEAVHDVDAVSGCVMLIRREVFDRIGFLDEAYFFSFEDLDFCLRARAAGFRIACVPDARAYHEGGRTIGRRSPRRVYFATRNHLRLAARTGSPVGRPLRTCLVVGLNAAYVLVSPEVPLFGGAAALVRGAWDHFRGRYGCG